VKRGGRGGRGICPFSTSPTKCYTKSYAINCLINVVRSLGSLSRGAVKHEVSLYPYFLAIFQDRNQLLCGGGDAKVFNGTRAQSLDRSVE